MPNTRPKVSAHLLAFALALPGLALLQPAAALANCVAPTPELLWSYPEDGAVDVPTDAAFWLLSSGWSGAEAVTLNGAALSSEEVGTFSARRIRPGPLEPSTDYVLELSFPSPGGAPEPAKFEIAFTTGTAPASAVPAAPTVEGTSMGEGLPEGHACLEEIGAQDCFDTGQSTLLSFQLSAQDDAIAWLVTNEYAGASNLWPKRCGDPAIFGSREGCYELAAIGEGGTLGPTQLFCIPGPPAPGNPGSFVDAGTGPMDPAGVAGGQSDPAPGSDAPGGEPASQADAAADDGGSCSVAHPVGASAQRRSLAGAGLSLWLLCALRIGRSRRRSSLV